MVFISCLSLFFQECPSGVVNEETFKEIYSQFFPQGGEYLADVISTTVNKELCLSVPKSDKRACCSDEQDCCLKLLSELMGISLMAGHILKYIFLNEMQ